MSDRFSEIQALVSREERSLTAAAARLREFAEADELLPNVAVDFAERLEGEAKALVGLRRGLLDLCELSLSDELVARIKGAFAAVGMTRPEDRQALAEMVADRDITAIADLTQPEAERLLAEIRKLEEPF